MNGKNSTLGEVKGKIELLIGEVLPRIEGKISRIEVSLDNHLKHHLHTGEKQGDRWFKIAMVALQAGLSAMVMFLLARK